jgi:pimeloyl-ACP methyl ester carboxylesterase
MAKFASSDGAEIAFDDISPPGGGSRAVLLVHGFASNRNEGWRRTGWHGAFERRGLRVIAIDQRGHGESAKLYEPEAYTRDLMAGDVLALMDHLGLGRVDLFGYSMGTRTALACALRAPERIENLILGGVGGKLLEPPGPDRGAMTAEAMLAEDPSTISDPFLKSFRQFADEQGEDRRALAAFVGASNPPLDPGAMAGLAMPVLVVAGERDELAGEPGDLARIFPRGKGVSVAGCDHFSAIPHALTKATVFDFLDGMLDDEFESRFR